jgi:hypothetical protein
VAGTVERVNRRLDGHPVTAGDLTAVPLLQEGERAGEAGDERGVLQDVEQVDRAPPAPDLGLQRAEVGVSVRLLSPGTRDYVEPVRRKAGQ